jgi:hypothetical protein
MRAIMILLIYTSVFMDISTTPTEIYIGEKGFWQVYFDSQKEIKNSRNRRN